MRILFLSRWFPYPHDNGSKLRVYNVLRVLSRLHSVTLISFVDSEAPAIPPELTAYCTAVHTVPYAPYNPTSQRALLGFLSITPRSAVDTYSPTMDATIRRVLQAGAFDLVIASQWDIAAYYSAFVEVPALFEEVELGIFDAKRASASSFIQQLRHELPWFKLRLYLRRLAQQFSAFTVVSQPEADLLRSILPNANVHIIPNCVAIEMYASVEVEPEPNSLIFTGALSYFANEDAMEWFLRDIYPRIQARVPDTNLRITGDPAGKSFPESTGVTLTGFVDDIRPLVAGSLVSIAPFLLGGGTRLKILEAMALHTPVVATTKGAEGLDVVDGEHVLIADTPDAFASAVIRLLEQPALRQRLAENAYQLLKTRYTWTGIAPQLLELVESVATAQPASALHLADNIL